MKKIFLDTEFTNFNNPELISIGLVSDCGERALYLESSSFSYDRCSDFVRDMVLPHLSGSGVSNNEMHDMVNEWLRDLGEFAIVTDCPHYDIAFLNAVTGKKLVYETFVIDDYDDAQHEIVREVTDAYFMQNPGEWGHHALTDAKIMRLAYIKLHDAGLA